MLGNNISLRSGLSLDHLPPTKVTKLIDVDELKAGIEGFRGMWKEATGGDLHQVTLDLGLLFDDLAVFLGVDAQSES